MPESSTYRVCVGRGSLRDTLVKLLAGRRDAETETAWPMAARKASNDTLHDQQKRKSPHSAGFSGTSAVNAPRVQAVGGGRSLARTRLRGTFLQKGKFQGIAAIFRLRGPNALART